MIDFIKEFLSLLRGNKSNTPIPTPININITIGNNNDDTSIKASEKDKGN